MKRRDIYYADVNDLNETEQKGIVPVLVLQNTEGMYIDTVIVAIISSRQKKNRAQKCVHIQNEELPEISSISLEHIYTIEKSLLIEYIGKLSKDSMAKVDNAIIVSLGTKYMEKLL